MLKVFVFFVCVCAVFGLPVDQKPVIADQPYVRHPLEIVPIVSEDFENRGDGTFRFGFVSADGTKVQEEGALNIIDEKTAEEVVRGSYEYVNPEGRTIKVDYIADANGFHPFSDDIPKSADVGSPSEYTNYLQGRQQFFQNAYNPLVKSDFAPQQPAYVQRTLQQGQYQQPGLQQPIYVQQRQYQGAQYQQPGVQQPLFARSFPQVDNRNAAQNVVQNVAQNVQDQSQYQPVDVHPEAN